MDYRIDNKITISGETLPEAVEEGFSKLAAYLKIGNAAGYQLERVFMEPDLERGGIVLHIVAHGSDLLVNYDPANDPSKEYSCLIQAAIEDCPQRFDFDLEEGPKFDPFSDAAFVNNGMILGTILGLIDEAGRSHCKFPPDGNISTAVLQKFPTIDTVSPAKFVEYSRMRLAQCRPKGDKKTEELMVRISELALKLADSGKKDLSAWVIARAKTETYFRTRGKVTALAALRNERGLTQKQLAEAVNISTRQLQNYEKCPGSTLWSASKFVPQRLAKALGVNVSDIIDGDGFPICVEP